VASYNILITVDDFILIFALQIIQKKSKKSKVVFFSLCKTKSYEEEETAEEDVAS